MTNSQIIRVGRWSCIGGAAIGALGLLGTWLGDGLLTALMPGRPAMLPVISAATLLLGLAALLRHGDPHQPSRRSLSALIALGALTLVVGAVLAHLLGRETGFAELLFEHDGHPPIWASPATLVILGLLALALLCFERRAKARARPAEWLVLCAAVTALTALTGHILGAAPLYRVPNEPFVGVSLPAALGTLLVAIGLLLARPDSGFMRLITSPGPGGVLLRSMLLPAFLAPLAIAFFASRVTAVLGVDRLVVEAAILVSAMSVLSLFLLMLTAAPLDRAHAALESNRAWARDLIEHAPDAIFEANEDDVIMVANEAVCRLVGAKREDVIGHRLLEWVVPADRERYWQMRERLRPGEVHRAEWSTVTHEGRLIPVEVSLRVLSSGQWQGFARDVSERNHLEQVAAHAMEQLKGSEERFRVAFDEAPIGMALIDLEGCFMRTNRVLCELLGYEPEELAERKFQDVVHAEDVNADLGLATRLYRGEITRYQLETRCLRKDGTSLIALLSGAVVRDSGGRPVHYIAQIEDITRQKRVAHDQRFLAEVGLVLAASLDYEDTLWRIAQLAVRDCADFCIVDLVDDAGGLRRFRVASRLPEHTDVCAMLQRLPVARAEPSPIAAALETRQPVLLSRPLEAELSALLGAVDRPRALASLEVSSCLSAPLVGQGKIFGVITMLSSSRTRIYGQDDLRLAQELVQRAALAVENARLYRAAQRAVNARDELLGIVAHDLRNPLSTILMQVERLRNRPAERLQNGIVVIERAATRMNRLIQDLLDVTRMEAGTLAIEQARLSAAGLVRDAAEVQRPLATSASLELQVELSGSLPDVWADRDRMLQVFENLIGNALKFTEPGGQVTVGAAKRDEEVLFWVSDTGTGIATADQPHVFDRFWQANGRHRGAGLGLPIVKGIIDAHGGHVWVESEEGRGSTFFFTIPTAPPAGSRHAETATSASHAA